jgi:hypothetical protein
MKGLFLLILSLITFCTCISAQQVKKEQKKNMQKAMIENLSPQARHDLFIQKSNNKKMLGWFSLGLGGSMILGGTAKMLSESFKDVPKTDIRLIWLPAAGILASVGSYFIIKDSKQMRKKAALMLQQESTHIGHPQHIPLAYPTVGIRISID